MRKHICVRPPFSPFATEKMSLLLSKISPLSALRSPPTPSGIWDHSHCRLFLLLRELHLSLMGSCASEFACAQVDSVLKTQNKTEKKHIPPGSSQPLPFTAELLRRPKTGCTHSLLYSPPLSPPPAATWLSSPTQHQDGSQRSPMTAILLHSMDVLHSPFSSTSQQHLEHTTRQLLLFFLYCCNNAFCSSFVGSSSPILPPNSSIFFWAISAMPMASMTTNTMVTPKLSLNLPSEAQVLSPQHPHLDASGKPPTQHIQSQIYVLLLQNVPVL